MRKHRVLTVVGGALVFVLQMSGGAALRLRTPGRRSIVSVTANGVKLPASRWNATDETISFPPSSVTELTSGPIEVCYAKQQ